MDVNPIFYLIAVVLMVAALFSLRYEFMFLTNNKVGVFHWVISIVNLTMMLGLILVLMFHTIFSILACLQLIIILLMALMAVSGIQLVTRKRLFLSMAKDLGDERRKVIQDMKDMIDEKKREKIRQKYEEDENTDPPSNGQPHISN